MAEILALIAFPIAAYQTIEKFYEFGQFVSEQIKSYKNAPEEVGRIKQFMEDMYNGELRRNMERTKWVFEQDDVSDFTKKKVSDSLKELKKQLEEIQDRLKKSFDEQGNLHKNTYIWMHKRRLVYGITSLGNWQLQFWAELQNICTDRTLPDPLNLCMPQFAPRAHMWNVAFDSRSPARLGRAEFREKGDPREVFVLIEEVHKQEGDGTHSLASPSTKEREAILNEAKIIARELARKLQFSTNGILRCLGYRDCPTIQLVFEVPLGYSRPWTLRQLLVDGRTGRNKDILAPWEFRFRLSKELVISVYSINAARYVHKNIRPDTILTFSKHATKTLDTGLPIPEQLPDRAISFDNLGPIYLTDWRMLRKQNISSGYQGDNVWAKNFYRHPKRQGLDPQERYEAKHDVYSLGICLLELGLWQSFLVEKAGAVVLSNYFLSAAEEHADYPRSNFDNTDPSKLNAFCASGKLIDIFKSIAKARLPMHMGTPFAQLVIKCLTNAEGGFGDRDIFTGDKAMVNFQQLILNDSPIASFNAEDFLGP